MGQSLKWLEVWEAKGMIAPSAPAAPAPDCSESEFQTAVVKLATAHGWTTHHHYDPRKSSAGWFDLVLAKLGRVLFVELKTEAGVQSDEQLKWFALFASAGEEVYCWRPSSWPIIVDVLTGGP